MCWDYRELTSESIDLVSVEQHDSERQSNGRINRLKDLTFFKQTLGSILSTKC